MLGERRELVDQTVIVENLCEGQGAKEGAWLGPVPRSPWLRDLHEFITTINSYLEKVVYRLSA